MPQWFVLSYVIRTHCMLSVHCSLNLLESDRKTYSVQKCLGEDINRLALFKGNLTARLFV